MEFLASLQSVSGVQGHLAHKTSEGAVSFLCSLQKFAQAWRCLLLECCQQTPIDPLGLLLSWWGR